MAPTVVNCRIIVLQQTIIKQFAGQKMKVDTCHFIQPIRISRILYLINNQLKEDRARRIA